MHIGSIIKGILRISTHPTGKAPQTQERDGSEDHRRDQRKSSIRSIDGEDDEGNGVGNQLGCGGEGTSHTFIRIIKQMVIIHDMILICFNSASRTSLI